MWKSKQVYLYFRVCSTFNMYDCISPDVSWTWLCGRNFERKMNIQSWLLLDGKSNDDLGPDKKHIFNIDNNINKNTFLAKVQTNF